MSYNHSQYYGAILDAMVTDINPPKRKKKRYKVYCSMTQTYLIYKGVSVFNTRYRAKEAIESSIGRVVFNKTAMWPNYQDIRVAIDTMLSDGTLVMEEIEA